MKLTNEQVRALLPHRPPFLLVDEVVDGEPGVRCVALRTLRDDDWWFAGHFPGSPVMPGVLIVEGMAQCSGFIALKILAKTDPNFDPNKPKIIYFMMIDKCKFRRPVLPGDKLEYEITVMKLSSRIAKFAGVATVNGEKAAEAEMTAMMNDK